MISSEISTFSTATSPVCLKSSKPRSGTCANAAMGSTGSAPSKPSLVSTDFAAKRAKSPSCPFDTWLTSFLMRKRSYSASSSSDSGNSLLAPTRHSSGTGSRSVPLSKRRSFRIVSSAFRMAEFALKISSMNATSAVGRYPSVFLLYSSRSSPLIDSGPNSSSGTEKRVSKRSKYSPPVRDDRRLDSSDLAVPGGPSSSRCSPQSAASSIKRTSISRSNRPSCSFATDLSTFARRDVGSASPTLASRVNAILDEIPAPMD
mmetsp:Transcript_1056/g.3258  ORF Transcript_1056/g.3258 Transcript_1056/m.3258 type:complete len:260 (-) Transcript_1056:429-1208(-)